MGKAFRGQGLGRVSQGLPLRTNRGENVRQVVARLGFMVVGARLGNVGLLAGGVAVPVLHTRVGDAGMSEDEVLFSFYELTLVCFKKGTVLVAVLRANL